MQNEASQDPNANLSAHRVLIVSGNRFTCQLVRSLLTAIEIGSIEVSHDLNDAEAQLGVSIFDLFIVDAGPAAGFDGLGFVEMLRGMPDRTQSKKPVILLVTQPTTEQIERAQRHQIKHVIAKPFSPAALYNHMQRVLEESPMSVTGRRQRFPAKGRAQGSAIAMPDTSRKN